MRPVAVVGRTPRGDVRLVAYVVPLGSEVPATELKGHSGRAFRNTWSREPSPPPP